MPIPLLPLAVVLATGGAGLTFSYYLTNTYEGKIFNLLKRKEESAQDKNFPENYGLSESLALDIIGIMRKYAVRGLNVDQDSQLLKMRDFAVTQLNMPDDPQTKNRALAFMMAVRDTVKTTDQDLYQYLHGGLTDRDKTLKRVSNITRDVAEVTPTFLHPKNVVLVGGIAIGLYLLWPLLKKARGKF